LLQPISEALRSKSRIVTAAAERVTTVDVLRGIAALAVSWFHFTHGNPRFLDPGVVKASGAYGWLGVEIFFVISGFVIPHALARGAYRLSDYPRFLLKRIIRLDPPYLATIVIVVSLAYLSAAAPWYRGPQPQVSPAQIMLHLGYLNVFFGYPWLDPVFWTLAIELQYYITVGFFFPLLVSSSRAVRLFATTGMIACAVTFPAEQFVPHWLPLFLLGSLSFQLKHFFISRLEFVLCVAAVTGALAITHNTVIAGVGFATVLIIACARLRPVGPLALLGTVSYSLYLLHVPVGGRVINLGERMAHTAVARFAFLVGALTTSLIAAWLLYRFVERPAQEWSSRIRYSPARKDGAAGERTALRSESLVQQLSS
jgi:peptidoglycan/LPS O-acetylase OafA/YrhL